MLEVTKQQVWEDLQKRFKRVVDRLGKHIDKDIMDTVIVLNASGIHTTASCEGHLDHGAAYPWIDIGSPDIDELAQKIIVLLHEGKRDDEETKQLQRQHRLLYLQEEQKLVTLLDAFYQQHQMAYDRHLSIWRFSNGAPRLQSHGADYQEFRSPDEQSQKLKEYQDEMQAFSIYLKQIYFQE
jgi:hypothetical protein